MNTSLEETYQLIIQEKCPAFLNSKVAVPADFVEPYLNMNKYSSWKHLEQIIGESNYRYQSEKLVQEIKAFEAADYQLPYKAFQEKYKHSAVAGRDRNGYHDLTENLFMGDWDKDEAHYPILRQIIFWYGHSMTKSYGHRTNLWNSRNTKYHKEFFLLILLGLLKKGTFVRILELFFILQKQNYVLPTLTETEWNWLMQFIQKEAHFETSKAFEKALRVFLALEKELYQKKEALDWSAYAKIGVENLPSWPKVSAFSDLETLELLQLFSFYSYFSEHTFDTSRLQAIRYYCSQKIDWDENYIAKYFTFLQQNEHLVAISDEIQKFAENQVKTNQFTETLYQIFWDYNLFLKEKKVAGKNGDDILLKANKLKQMENLEITYRTKLMSGFSPVGLSYNHNPYHGLHPDQIRPYFRILREVTPIDIIKFYKVNNLYRVKFLIKEKIFDIATGDGFGLGCVGDLNTILFENGVPYQFVCLQKKQFFSFYKAKYNRKDVQTITLINQSNYTKFEGNIPKQEIAGFASSAVVPVPPFTANIIDLKKLNAKPHLDQIDLANDPKFLSIKKQVALLKPEKDWSLLIAHLLTYPLDKKPGKTWQKIFKTNLEKIPLDNFQSGLTLLSEAMMTNSEWFEDEEKLAGLRGTTWACRFHANSSLLFRLQQIANKAYKKIPGGPRNAKLGNIALESLAVIGSMEAYSALSNMKAKAKYSVYLRAINRTLKKFNHLLKGINPEELADKVISTHDLKDNKKIIDLEDYQSIIQLEGLKTVITWQNAKGKITKSVPAYLRKERASEVKTAKAEAKSIEETINAQAKRLESSWSNQRQWSYENWQTYYYQHPLMRLLVEKLVWQMEVGETSTAFMVQGDTFINVQKEKMDIPIQATIRLWHPTDSPTADVLRWRNYLFDEKIKQPFKQAFREIYILTEAEENTFDHSNRFAAHVLRGNTLYSLGKTRGWTMSYEDAPYLKLPEAGLMAVLNISGRVLYDNCQTKELFFVKVDSSSKNWGYWRKEKLPLNEVPPVILSEVMRDVDLFVAVSSLGIDPYFNQNEEGELLNYWRNYSFGEKSRTAIAEVRKDLLERLIPMTKIAKQCSFEGNYLKVKGSLRTYKINLGSGNILMEPNDQYLCIVPAPNKKMEKKIWLPFEGGDKTLMIIISKAFLLAEDEKITESLIVSQINRR